MVLSDSEWFWVIRVILGGSPVYHCWLYIFYNFFKFLPFVMMSQGR